MICMITYVREAVKVLVRLPSIGIHKYVSIMMNPVIIVP